MEENIFKIKLLNFMTKDMPERKAGQFEGVVIASLLISGIFIVLSLIV